MLRQYKYYLKRGGFPEREVTKGEFILAERDNGFFPKSDKSDVLATGGFTGVYEIGRIELC